MKKRLAGMLVLVMTVVMLSGCGILGYTTNNILSKFKGREAVYQSYDEESNIIDHITAKSMDISADDTFATKDSEGNVTKSSGVLNVTVGGESLIHVGSSVIIRDKSLVDVFDEYSKTVDITNMDRSIPFINRMVNSMKNYVTGQKYLILVRSQSGKPLATFVGNKVSYFKTDIDKSTGIYIDGQNLFIYRCDYTIIPLSLLK